MSGYFISYSRRDASDFARRLADELLAGDPPADVWLDRDDIRAAEHWPEKLRAAIASCDAMLFLATRASVGQQSFCQKELLCALECGKPVITLRLHAEAELPLVLYGPQHLDFTRADASQVEFERAMARLRLEIRRRHSPEGGAQTKDEGGGPAPRPERACRVVNQPPFVPPLNFQGRPGETKAVADFLRDQSKRVLTVSGRAGTGKTALVCRVLRSLEGGRLPDDLGAFAADGIVYLTANDLHRISTPNIFADLCQLLPPEAADRLKKRYENPQVPPEMLMRELLAHFTGGLHVLLLDNFENLLDQETQNIAEAELEEALRAVLVAVHHSVKVVITTRCRPESLSRVNPGLQSRIQLDRGLDHESAKRILREMDSDGRAGLRDASEPLLEEVCQRTLGIPRALEALYPILCDGSTTLREILDEIRSVRANTVTEALVGEAFRRLDPAAQRVTQALAVYRHPVRREAVDYLLEPFQPGADNRARLRRLVSTYIVRREADLFSLQQADSDYALSQVEEGGPSDREADPPPFTRFSLLHRAAEYLKLTRKPKEEWKEYDDLAAPLAEFELRCAGLDYDAAARVLYDICPRLISFGHYYHMIDMHERISGKVADRELASITLGNLGWMCRATGQIPKAMEYYEQAYELAREIDRRDLMGRWQGFLGTCYAQHGDTASAITHVMRGLELARETGIRESEATRLGDLGNFYTMLGDADSAARNYSEALDIALGIGDNPGVCRHLCNLADLLTEQGRYAEAVQKAQESARLARMINSPRHLSFSHGSVALAYFFAGQMDEARAAAEAARLYDEPGLNHHIYALLGIISLKQRDAASAAAAFRKAAEQCDALLNFSPRLYRVLDSKGLALCGLALCEKRSHAADAAAAYRAARAINSDKGVVHHAERLFDVLAMSDAEGVLAGVRPAVVGEGTGPTHGRDSG